MEWKLHDHITLRSFSLKFNPKSDPLSLHQILPHTNVTLFGTLRTQEFQEELLYLGFFHGLTQTKPKLPHHN